MQYPILITEVPHRGPRRTWILHNERHLGQCIEAAEGFEGGTLDEYLEWLESDLQRLIVEPNEEETEQ